MLRNFHEEIWIRMTNKSNWLIIIIATQFSKLLVNDDTIYDKILNIIKSLEKPEKLLQWNYIIYRANESSFSAGDGKDWFTVR